MAERSEEASQLSNTVTAVPILAAIAIVIFSPFINLVGEEAYYYQYAAHLDLGYLDHPPMVAWVMALFLKLLGISEFGVRCGAFVCWLIAAYFVFKLSESMFDRTAARASLMVFAVLPYCFQCGFFMTPDSVMLPCWAASLYYFHQALIKEHANAWWGVALALGLGALSKYTIALVGLSAFLFMLIDQESRKYFFTKNAYLAACAALLLFAPVILWNYEHSWASFAFQSVRRLDEKIKFATMGLLGDALILMTPAGALTFFAFFKEKELFLSGDNEHRRSFLFSVVFTFVPFWVFVFASLRHGVKMHWTGPCFIASLPIFGLYAAKVFRIPIIGLSSKTLWVWMAWLLTSLYFLSFFYLAYGIPGAPYTPTMHKILSWSEVGRETARRVEEHAARSGRPPVVVGLDTHFISSELAFYLARYEFATGRKLPMKPVAGTALFGRKSLMYAMWSSAEAVKGDDVILVSKNSSLFEDAGLRSHFQTLSAPEEFVSTKNGYATGKYYFAIGSGFQP